MAWARIDDNFFSHPKVRKAGKDAVILYMAALCHSNAYMTEGYIADEVLGLIGVQAFQNQPKKAAEKLVQCGLFIRVEDGYLIHDFLEYNYSREQIEELKAKRAAAGKLGGRPPKQKQTESKLKANENQNALQTESKQEANKNQTKSHTHTHINTHTTKEKETAVAAAFQAYESEIGMLTATVSDEIKLALEEYPEDWIVKAIKESALQNKRNWKYTAAILKRWKSEGINTDSRQKKAQTQSLEKFRALYQQQQKEKDV